MFRLEVFTMNEAMFGMGINMLVTNVEQLEKIVTNLRAVGLKIHADEVERVKNNISQAVKTLQKAK